MYKKVLYSVLNELIFILILFIVDIWLLFYHLFSYISHNLDNLVTGLLNTCLTYDITEVLTNVF